jgi:chaperonin GroEL
MKTQYLTGHEALEMIRDTFKKVHDLVVPTMGAKGLMAIINDPFGQPTLTDDGVTVIKSLRNFEGFKQMILKSMIEAAHNTERLAFDGTTLTVQMLWKIFEYGYNRILEGEHPQIVADNIQQIIEKILLKIEPIDMKPNMVKHVASIATKIPELGEVIERVYHVAGRDMNILIAHAQGAKGMKIEHSEGMVLNSGYMTPALKDNGLEFKNARIALLKTGSFSKQSVNQFFGSITNIETPIVYVVTPDFNPEAMRMIIETSMSNSMTFQFVFLNEGATEDLYLDLAALTSGKIQDPAYGIKEYTFDMCGTVEYIKIGQFSTVINQPTNFRVQERIEKYNEKLESDKYSLSEKDKVMITNRLGSLTNKLVKLWVGAPSLLEFSAIKLKLDDAIGAVKKAFQYGVVIGGGKALFNLRNEFKDFAAVLEAPHRQILQNAGYELPDYRTSAWGVDVSTGRKVELIQHGIIDGYASIRESLINASSIATGYLKAYALIKEGD